MGQSERSRLVLEIDVRKLLSVSVTHDETVGRYFSRPGRGEAAGGHWFVSLFSTDTAKDRTVANIRRLAVVLQPLGHFTTDR